MKGKTSASRKDNLSSIVVLAMLQGPTGGMAADFSEFENRCVGRIAEMVGMWQHAGRRMPREGMPELNRRVRAWMKCAKPTTINTIGYGHGLFRHLLPRICHKEEAGIVEELLEESFGARPLAGPELPGEIAHDMMNFLQSTMIFADKKKRVLTGNQKIQEFTLIAADLTGVLRRLHRPDSAVHSFMRLFHWYFTGHYPEHLAINDTQFGWARSIHGLFSRTMGENIAKGQPLWLAHMHHPPAYEHRLQKLAFLLTKLYQAKSGAAQRQVHAELRPLISEVLCWQEPHLTEDIAEALFWATSKTVLSGLHIPGF